MESVNHSLAFHTVKVGFSIADVVLVSTSVVEDSAASSLLSARTWPRRAAEEQRAVITTSFKRILLVYKPKQVDLGQESYSKVKKSSEASQLIEERKLRFMGKRCSQRANSKRTSWSLPRSSTIKFTFHKQNSSPARLVRVNSHDS